MGTANKHSEPKYIGTQAHKDVVKLTSRITALEEQLKQANELIESLEGQVKSMEEYKAPNLCHDALW